MTQSPSLLKPFDLSLAHQAMFSVSDASGVQISCREGSLWVTLDNDPRDVVLAAGESFVTTQHRRALIYAMQPSSLSLGTTEAAATRRPAGRGAVGSGARVILEFQPA